MKQLVVITRFNLALKDRYRKLYRNTSSDHKIWLDEEYLDKRFELFEKYTYPSFCSQTDHDYRWIVLFHKDTPKKFIDRIDGYKADLREFEPWFLDDEESDRFVEIIGNDLAEYKELGGVVTVRVDNDDAIHAGFIAAIKSGLSECQDTAILTFKNGLQYDTRSGRCMRYSYVNNHFIAYYTAVKDMDKNIFSFEHVDADSIVDRSHKYIIRTRTPMWVEIVSGTNCVNEIWCRPSKVFVPYKVKDEYPFLHIKWQTRLQWIMGIAGYLPIAFIRMIVDCVRLIVLRFREDYC